MATGSVVTLWPAMNIIFSAIADNPCNSSKIEMTYLVNDRRQTVMSARRSTSISTNNDAHTWGSASV